MKLPRIPFLICLFLLLFLPRLEHSSLVHAQALFFEEFFDDPSLPEWQHTNQAYVEDGVLVLNQGGYAHHPDEWTNFQISFRAEFSGQGDFLIQYKSKYYLLFNGERFHLQQSEGENFTAISEPIQYPIPPGEWFQVNIIVEGGSQVIQINQEEIYRLILPESLSQGGIAFEIAGDSAARVDDLSVINIDIGTENPPRQTPDTDITTPEPTLTDDSAITIDPGQVQLTWVRTGGPPGGLGYDIRYNFDNPDTWYATDNYGGVHISQDNGITWHQGNEGIPPQSGPSGDAIPIFCLTVDPNDPQILWSGTDMTGHIYKSTDGGKSWVQKDHGVEIEYDALSFRGFTVDPHSSDIVYAMGETTRYESGDPVWTPKGGVVYKTIDGGENWILIWDGDIPSSLTRYLWVNPDNTNILYVSTGIFDRGAVGQASQEEMVTSLDPFGGLGVLKSTDGGETWRTLGKEQGLDHLYVGSLFMDPEDPDILLAATGHYVTEILYEYYRETGESPIGVYRTTDGGESWTRVIAPIPGVSGEVFTAVDYCPSDSQIVYAGSNAAVYRSSDGGVTWENVTGESPGWGPPGTVGGLPIDMQCDPRNPDRVFANNYLGGNYLSEDGGKTWIGASDGYTGAQIISVAVDPDQSSLVFSSGRNGVYRSTDGGSTWQGIIDLTNGPSSFSGLGAIRVDPSQSGRVLLGVEGLLTSENLGQTWSFQMLHGVTPMVAALEFAPSNPKVLYAGAAGHNTMVHPEVFSGSGMIISKDGGETWEIITGDEFNNVPVLDIAIDPNDPETVYAATQNGLFNSINSGEDWRSFTGLPQGSSRTVGISPRNSNWIFAGIELIGLYSSQDGGVSWKQVSAGLEPNGSHRDLVFDPANPQIVYLADLFSGVYRSTDEGISWEKINNGLSTRAVTSLSISSDGQHLYAGTNGEGVFRLDLNGIPPAVSAIIISDQDQSSVEDTNTPNNSSDSSREEITTEPFNSAEKPPDQTKTSTLLLVGFAFGVICCGAVIWLLLNRKRKGNEKI